MLSFVLKKLIGLFEPLSLIALALLWLAWRLHREGLKKPLRTVLIIGGFMFVMTCVPTTDRMLASVENPWRSIAGHWDELPQADVILCLGGGTAPSAQEIIGVDMFQASDRVTTAIELLRRGKAPLLLVSGGLNPDGGPTESEAVKSWIEHWQLAPASKVEILPPCVDTHDEAMRLAEIARQRGWTKVLLVTSASHMKRAAEVVRKPGAIEVIPVPCAFQTGARMTDWLHLPDAGCLTSFSIWFHEVVGWWVYKARGWI
jgi:uncharacterized SAM-binding protein YcdF (DUF218 family)